MLFWGVSMVRTAGNRSHTECRYHDILYVVSKNYPIVFTILFVLPLFLLAPPDARAITRSIVFPVQAPYSFRDDYLDPRGGGTRRHLGIDIIAPKMTPVFATADGIITYVVLPEASWGYALEVRDSDGYEYSYLHLNNDTPGTDDGRGGPSNAYAPDIARSVRVTKGQLVGWLGDSGNAENTISHLHFEIQDPNHVNINPYESLLAAAATGAMTVAPEGAVQHEEIPAFNLDPTYPSAITRELKLNNHGKMVELLQEKLKGMGHYASAYITDHFDALTRDAVIRFQRANGIEETGIVEYGTRVLLNKGTGFEEPAPPEPATEEDMTENLQEGSRGSGVTELQSRLKYLGYYTSSVITDYFGPITKAAVIEFQKANNIPQTGVVGPMTRAALTKLIPPGTVFTFTSDLRKGMRGREIDALQFELRKLGFYTSAYITGEFDALTYDAVIRFQRANGIPTTGIVGPLTRKALYPNSIVSTAPAPVSTPISSSMRYIFAQNLEEGARGEAVRQLQLKLKSLGYFTHAITDYFGPVTKAAVMQFQRANGIEPIGVVGPKTRALLNGN